MQEVVFLYRLVFEDKSEVTTISFTHDKVPPILQIFFHSLKVVRRHDKVANSPTFENLTLQTKGEESVL